MVLNQSFIGSSPSPSHGTQQTIRDEPLVAWYREGVGEEESTPHEGEPA
jgi:hypothetical protein